MSIKGQGQIMRHKSLSLQTLILFFLKKTVWIFANTYHVKAFGSSGSKNLYNWARLHDQDGRHAHIL